MRLDDIAAGKVAGATPAERALAAQYAAAFRQVSEAYLKSQPRAGETPAAAGPAAEGGAAPVPNGNTTPTAAAAANATTTPTAGGFSAGATTPTQSEVTPGSKPDSNDMPPARVPSASATGKTPTEPNLPGGDAGRTPTAAGNGAATPAASNNLPADVTPAASNPPERPLTHEDETTNVTPHQDGTTEARTEFAGGSTGRSTAGLISHTAEGQLGRVKALVENSDPRGADGGALRKISPAAWSEALGRPELSDEVARRILALRQLAEPGGEGVATTDGTFVYKVYSPRADGSGSGIGITGRLERTPDGFLGMKFVRGTVADVVEKASVLSHMGMPTEVVGIIGSTGEVVTKQPLAFQANELPPGQRTTNIRSELARMHAAIVPMAGNQSQSGNWLTNVNGRYYVISDINPRNVLYNSQGAARPFDVVVCPVSEADFAQHPELQDVRHQVEPLSPDKPF
jgi:hypothetical protein